MVQPWTISFTTITIQNPISGDLIELGEPFDHAGDGFLVGTFGALSQGTGELSLARRKP